MKLKELVKKGENFAKKNSPSILTGVTIVGIITLSFMNIYPKVKKIMEEHRDEMDSLRVNDVSKAKRDTIKKDRCAKTVKEIAKATIPTILVSGVSITSCVFANQVSSRRLAAATAAYELTSMSLSNLRDSIEEVVPKKAKEIKEISATKMLDNPVNLSDMSGYIQTGFGNVPCIDPYTKVKWLTSHEAVKDAIRDLSDELKDGFEEFVSIADLYYKFGLYNANIPPMARDLGWSEKDLIEDKDGRRLLPIIISHVWDETGTVPIMDIEYDIDTRFNTREGGRFR